MAKTALSLNQRHLCVYLREKQNKKKCTQDTEKCLLFFPRNFGVQSLEDLPAINPVQVEDFKAEAEEEVELRLNV